MNKQQLTTARDCKPTIVWNDTLMSGEWVFIEEKEAAKKYCVEKRCCDNLNICLTIAEKLKENKLKEAFDLLDY